MDTTTRTLEREGVASENTTMNETMPEECRTGVCEMEGGKEEENGGQAATTYVPAVDVIEGEGSVRIFADVPGVSEGGVELTVEKSVLTLTARPGEGEFGGKKLAYSEYGVGEYRCSFALSEEIDKEGISASLRDGVLMVELPKRAPISKKIAVITA